MLEFSRIYYCLSEKNYSISEKNTNYSVKYILSEIPEILPYVRINNPKKYKIIDL